VHDVELPVEVEIFPC